MIVRILRCSKSGAANSSPRAELVVVWCRLPSIFLGTNGAASLLARGQRLDEQGETYEETRNRAIGGRPRGRCRQRRTNNPHPLQQRNNTQHYPPSPHHRLSHHRITPS